ncbi:MAG TPA: hypothetical protein VFE20_06610 [Thermoleophilia bacterium]|nr:hypothetical protein [Thermoleophilia bacterium]
MKMKTDWIAQRMPSGPDRLRALVDELEADAGWIEDSAATSPAAVQKAVDAFRGACADALGRLDALDEATAAAIAARAADVEAAAAAIREGKPAPSKLRVTAARTVEEAALIGLEAHEAVVIDAHRALTEAVRDNWAAWRRTLAQGALEADREAKRLLPQLAAVLSERQANAVSVQQLDDEVTGRFAALREQVEADERGGVRIYAAVRRAGQLYFDGDEQLAEIQENLEEELLYLTEWAPPGDPHREKLLTKPVDYELEWVKAALVPNLICRDCGRRVGETAADVTLDPETLKPIHNCARLPGRL